MSASFVAQYSGHCQACEESIVRGDLVRYVDGYLVHEDCDNLPGDPTPAAVCPKCFLTTCDCEKP